MAFNLAWNVAWFHDLKVLLVDLDPQSNLSQYLLGAEKYFSYVGNRSPTVDNIFEQPSAHNVLVPSKIIHPVKWWRDYPGVLHLIPSRLELTYTLKNPTNKAHLLSSFLKTESVQKKYDLIIIDCAPTDSILTTAAYLSSQYLVIPVKPEFLATIGLPLLVRSLNEHKSSYKDQDIEIAGIIFNDADNQRVKPEYRKARLDVNDLAQEHGWAVFANEVRHSDSHATGARASTPIFDTNKARNIVKDEFDLVTDEFLEKVGLK